MIENYINSIIKLKNFDFINDVKIIAIKNIVDEMLNKFETIYVFCDK